MKIVMINNYYYLRGGSERVFFSEIKLLEKHGHIVGVFSRNHQENFPSKYSHFYPPDIQTDKIKIDLSAIKLISEIIYSQKNKKFFKKFLDSFKPHVIHAHNIYGRITTSVLDVAKNHGLPVVMTLHDYKLICPNYKLMRNGRVCEDCKGKKFYMAILNKCHKNSYLASLIYAIETAFNKFLGKYQKNVNYFIAPSHFLKNKLIEFGMDREKIVYIPNFIDLNKYEANYSFKDYFLYFGRISIEKGIDLLIDAFCDLNLPKIKLMIVGEGPIKAEMQKRAEKLNNNNVKFTGYLSGEKLKKTIQNALAVILPSKWYENAPMSILEAFACGKPVIGAKIGGITEIIEDGIDGYLFEPRNKGDLQSKLRLMMQKPFIEIKEMGQNARKKVEQEYNAKLHYERLMEIYEKVYIKS